MQAGSTSAAILTGIVTAWSQPDSCRPPAAGVSAATAPAVSAAAAQDAQQLKRLDRVAWAAGDTFHAGNLAAAAAATLIGSTSAGRKASSHADDARRLRVRVCSRDSGSLVVAALSHDSVSGAARFVRFAAASAAATASVTAAGAASAAAAAASAAADVAADAGAGR
jgi:hypothetical protein